MNLAFSKLQGTGNDFIMIDDWNGDIGPKLTETDIKNACSRHTGIGADGLILIQKTDAADLHMIYYNADGRQSSMCGNGGRCTAYWAYTKGLAPKSGSLLAIDGSHTYQCDDLIVSLHMRSAELSTLYGGDYIIDTGSPHYVKFVEDIPEDFVDQAREIRESPNFLKEGINVNFVIEIHGGLDVRSYERGVENETLSCGTGVTAAALVYSQKNNCDIKSIPIHTKGGSLMVSYDRVIDNRFEGVILSGPVNHVFDGIIRIE